jgi:dTDP-4-dehydrorhamnose 3,5-epimerase
MNRFSIQETPIEGLKIIQRTLIGDTRGFLSRIFCAQELTSAGWLWPIAQINHTLTKIPGTVRGMHFQFPPRAEAKLVSCIRGAVWDVAVDIRRGSPTFLKWHAAELSAANQSALLIPPGFAHGFQTLEPESELLYLHSASYEPACEGALNPRDPSLAISWPSEISSISEKDSNRPMLDPSFQGVTL